MSLCRSSFWSHRHKCFPPPPPSPSPLFLHLSFHRSSCLMPGPPIKFSLAISWSVCKLFLQFLSFPSALTFFHASHRLSIFLPLSSLSLFVVFFFFLVNQHNNSPFGYFLPPLCPSNATTPILYRWRLTWECSTIRPPDCLLLRRWMEAPSASLTQPQLHQPP